MAAPQPHLTARPSRPLPRRGDSWTPASRLPSATVSSTIRAVGQSIATWVVLLALAIDLLAVGIEPTLLLWHGAPAQAALASTCAALGLSMAFSLAAAIPIASVYSLVRWTGRFPRPWSRAWPLPLVGLAWLVTVCVAPDPFVQVENRQLAQAGAFALLVVWLVLATLVARFRKTTRRTIATVLLLATTFVLSLALPPTVHQEPRDLLWLCTVVGFSAFLYPLRRRLAEGSPTRVARVFFGLCGSSLALLLVAPVLCPSWRVYAFDFGAYAERLSRFCRTLTDFDDDGYSSAFGGTDCDNFDSQRYPALSERADGRDRNCNGTSRPPSPTLAQRGLSPAAGEPDAAPGEIDRVVLITIDCFRADALSPSVTPHLADLATRGVTLRRLYAGGARTATSLPLLLRGAYSLPPVASVLAGAGASSTAVFAYRHSTISDNVFRGFGAVSRPAHKDERWRATEVTDRALADLRDPTHARAHFLWVHYFDAHGPRTARVLPADTPRFSPIVHESDDSALYLSELWYVDKEVGRLLDGIEQTRAAAGTMIIVTGDHGEAFGFHNVYEHGKSAFEQVIHVPGILVAPGVAPGTYDHVLSERDLAATVLGAFGLVSSNPRAEEFGRSLLRLRAAPQSPLHDFVVTYSSSTHVQSWTASPLAVRTDDHAKLAVGYREGIQRFYHLDSNAAETRDVTFDFPQEAARDRQQLEIYRDIDSPPP